VATRRLSEQISRQAEHLSSLRVYADAAHAAYLVLRGELAPAIALYEKLLPAMPVRDCMAWLQVRVYFAQALNLSGQHARARRVLLEALAHSHPDDAAVAMHFCEAHRQLALAEAGSGNRERAESILDELFARYAELDNPLLLGLLHKARAEIALRHRDSARLEEQLERMQHYFRGTENPALIAQWEQLCERAAPLLQIRPGGATRNGLVLGPQRRADALRLALERAGGTRGYMYHWQAGELQRVESIGSADPPGEAVAELLRSILMLEEEDATNDDGLTLASFSEAPHTAAHSFQHVVLSTDRNGKRTILGGLIIETGASDFQSLDLSFRTALADALTD
jgi:tetratricopeptide (TPR) repeat protein